MKRIACLATLVLTGCPRQRSQDISCEPKTVERIVLSERPQQEGWGLPCVPLQIGDTFSVINRGSCPFDVTLQDAPQFIRDVTSHCEQTDEGVTCSKSVQDADAATVRITYGFTVPGDFKVTWHELSQEGSTVACTQQFEVAVLSETPGTEF